MKLVSVAGYRYAAEDDNDERAMWGERKFLLQTKGK